MKLDKTLDVVEKTVAYLLILTDYDYTLVILV